MDYQTPETPKPTAEKTSRAEETSPAESDDSLVDPPGYIPPNEQDMMLTDITSEILHSNKCTVSIGRGKEYLSPADSIALSWPATGIVYGYNRCLMICLPCRRAAGNRGYKVLNIFFLFDSGSPCSYLCKETMEALVDRPDCILSEELNVVVQNSKVPMTFHMSPLGTPEHPGKFHDVNVLGMDFLFNNGLSMVVDAPASLFKFVKKDVDEIFAQYTDEELN